MVTKMFEALCVSVGSVSIPALFCQTGLLTSLNGNSSFQLANLSGCFFITIVGILIDHVIEFGEAKCNFLEE